MDGPTSESNPLRFPEPASSDSPSELFVTYLDFYRESVVGKITGLSGDQLRTSILPSGWTALELIKHLVFMERRWIVWGFLGQPVPSPWGDNAGADPDAPWLLEPEDSTESLVDALRAGGRTTTDVSATHGLADLAPPGPRFGNREPASLLWICFHLINEYARHLGQLDVVRELIDGTTGE